MIHRCRRIRAIASSYATSLRFPLRRFPEPRYGSRPEAFPASEVVVVRVGRIQPSRIVLALAGGAVLAVLSLATPAAAFHRKTPPVIPITVSGDVNLPRIP